MCFHNFYDLLPRGHKKCIVIFPLNLFPKFWFLFLKWALDLFKIAFRIECYFVLCRFLELGEDCRLPQPWARVDAG